MTFTYNVKSIAHLCEDAYDLFCYVFRNLSPYVQSHVFCKLLRAKGSLYLCLSCTIICQDFEKMTLMKMNLIVFQKWKLGAIFVMMLTDEKTLGMNDAEPPGPARANLTFCTAPEYAANGCCSAQDDTTLSTTFKSMNISDATCAAVVKQILCSVSPIPSIFEMIIWLKRADNVKVRMSWR